MSSEELIFKIKADLFKCLGHPLRLAILEHLKEKESSVGDMAVKLGVEQSSLSKHLAILRQTGILASRHEKVTVYYFVRDKEIYVVLRTISHILMKKFKEGKNVLQHLAKT